MSSPTTSGALDSAYAVGMDVVGSQSKIPLLPNFSASGHAIKAKGHCMSKSNGTTKIATVVAFFADCGEELVNCGGDFAAAHRVANGCVLVETSRGLVAWDNGFSSALPGDKVVLRKDAPRSHGDTSWVMTGRA